MRPLRPRRDDEGVALALCLVVVVLLGLVVGALTDLAASSVLSTNRTADRRLTIYAAEGATATAIEYLRAERGRGLAGYPCAGFDATLNDEHATVYYSCDSPVEFPDRAVTLVTTVSGRIEVRADIVIRDSLGPTGSPPVEIVSWTYGG